MGDIAKAMIDLRDAQAFQAKVIELNREIMSAQGSALATQADHAAMVEEIRKLKAEIAALEAWEQEKKRYQLTDHGGGTFTYALKAGMEDPSIAYVHTATSNGASPFSSRTARLAQAGKGLLALTTSCHNEILLGVAIYPSNPTGARRGGSGWTG
jgi:hypothetical protein